MSVYKAINNVQAALCKIGITKDGRNTQGAGYNFRGIDQVYNTLSPLLAEHGLCILPRVVGSNQTERQSSKGGLLIYSYVTMEFDLVATSDGSKHTICTVGEAFDSGDKSMNKAMSAAYKYAAFQAFAIPTEGDNDADAHTHEVAPRKAPIIPARPVIELDPETEAFLQNFSSTCTDLVKQGKAKEAWQSIQAAALDDDQTIALANMMDSATRNAIKKAKAE